jgi:hypothetical protein
MPRAAVQCGCPDLSVPSGGQARQALGRKGSSNEAAGCSDYIPYGTKPGTVQGGDTVCCTRSHHAKLRCHSMARCHALSRPFCDIHAPQTHQLLTAACSRREFACGASAVAGAGEYPLLHVTVQVPPLCTLVPAHVMVPLLSGGASVDKHGSAAAGANTSIQHDVVVGWQRQQQKQQNRRHFLTALLTVSGHGNTTQC